MGFDGSEEYWVPEHVREHLRGLGFSLSLGAMEPMIPGDETLEKYLEVCAWADDQGYESRTLREFKAESRADAWLCAEALASGLTLVTYETVSNSVKKVKIPNVCAGMGIRCIGGFDFMRAQGFRF